MAQWILCSLALAVLLLACGLSEEERAEARRQGQHCLNLGGDTNDSFYAKVYSSLVDPNSLKEERTVIGPVIDGQHRIKMDFSARNDVGGVVRGTAIGWVDHETCMASLESIRWTFY